MMDLRRYVACICEGGAERAKQRLLTPRKKFQKYSRLL